MSAILAQVEPKRELGRARPVTVGGVFRGPDPVSQRERQERQYDEIQTVKVCNSINESTSRIVFYQAYHQGYLALREDLRHKDSIAVDLGCGTGSFMPHLAHNFDNVFGIDPSACMLTAAINNLPNPDLSPDNEWAKRVIYRRSPPERILGKVDYVSAINVHYNFSLSDDPKDPTKNLREEFFKVAADLLRPGGELLLIGVPSAHYRFAPPHYKYYINIRDIPPDFQESHMSDFGALQETESSEWVALDYVPVTFTPPAGTQLECVLSAVGKNRKKLEVRLTDTFWPDDTLQKTAEACNLEHTHKEFLSYRPPGADSRSYPRAYMAMHFRKPLEAAP